MGRDKVVSGVERITPDMATKLLEGNTHNRPFSSELAMKYANDMLNGRWELNGESIVISDTNRVLDGQHRLYGIFESGKPQEMLVVRGISDDAFKTMGTGRVRSTKDVFGIEKVPSPRNASAISKLCMVYEDRHDLNTKSKAPSHAVVYEWYTEHKEAVDFACGLCNPKLMGVASATAVGLIAVEAYYFKPRVEMFMCGLETGANLDAGSPIWVVRERLLREKQSVGGWVKTSYVAALLIKAWNAFICDFTMKKILYAPEKEAFPVMICTQKQLVKALS